MKPSKLDKNQVLKVVKAAAYIGVSAFLDALIAATTSSQFGVLMGPINLVLVLLKQVVTDSKA